MAQNKKPKQKHLKQQHTQNRTKKKKPVIVLY